MAWPGWRGGHPRSAGLTPSPGMASAMGPSACPSAGRVARLPQLRAVVQQRADPGPRAGARLPQREPRLPHADAAPDPHAPGGDGQHLLPDHRHQRRPGHGQRRRSWPSWKATSRMPARWWWTSTPGSCSSRASSSAAGPARALGGGAERADAGGPGRDLRRRPGSGGPAPLDVGGEAPLLLPRRSTTGPTPSACSSAWGCTPATGRTPAPSGPATTTSSPPPAWKGRSTWAGPGSTSLGRLLALQPGRGAGSGWPSSRAWPGRRAARPGGPGERGSGRGRVLIVRGGWPGHEPVETGEVAARELRGAGVEVEIAETLEGP